MRTIQLTAPQMSNDHPSGSPNCVRDRLVEVVVDVVGADRVDRTFGFEDFEHRRLHACDAYVDVVLLPDDGDLLEGRRTLGVDEVHTAEVDDHIAEWYALLER